jgi:hypothetical protein
LAKAQSELINPEKSLVAILPPERGQQARSFRYAPLSGGLEIVRKTLGKHEIAVVQTTSIDRDAGTIKLTTTLAHASGEWIASDWPVCPLADLPTPHRMGAALSYARRYALFTLVGIAGEDDSDAPDLPLVTRTGHGDSAAPLEPTRNHRAGKAANLKTVPDLNPQESRTARDRLLTEIESLGSLDQAADWVKRVLPTKNALLLEHVAEIETAFEVKFSAFVKMIGEIIESSESREDKSNGTAETALLGAIPTGITPLPIGPSARRRDKNHLRFVASQPCLLCSRRPSDAHHLRFAQPKAMGRKVSDEFTVPLCRTHHRQLHRSGDEPEWWKAMDADVDPIAVAQGLWNQSRQQLGAAAGS